MSGGMDHDKETCDCERHHPPLAKPAGVKFTRGVETGEGNLAPIDLVLTPGELVRGVADALDEVIKAFPDNGHDHSPPERDSLRLELVDHGDESLHHWEGDKYVRDGSKPHKRVTLFIDVSERSVSDEEVELAIPRLRALGIDDVYFENEEAKSFNITEW